MSAPKKFSTMYRSHARQAAVMARIAADQHYYSLVDKLREFQNAMMSKSRAEAIAEQPAKIIRETAYFVSCMDCLIDNKSKDAPPDTGFTSHARRARWMSSHRAFAGHMKLTAYEEKVDKAIVAIIHEETGT